MPRPVLRFLLTTNSTSPPPAKSIAAEPPLPVSVEPDYVIIIASLLCALICIIGLLSVARCAWIRRAGGAVRGHSAAATTNTGLKKKVLQSLPKFSFDPSSSTDSAVECAICLMEYTQGDEVKVLPQCGHRFHSHCIDMWLGSHSSCPSCRQILIEGWCQKCSDFPNTAQIQGRNCLT